MASRSKREAYYEKHQTAEELHDAASHAHLTGELHGKSDHLTDSEHARQEFERAQDERRKPHESTVGHGIPAFGHEEIAALAHELWEGRGCPMGSPEVDWNEAVKQLRLRALVHEKAAHEQPMRASGD